jgi:hypothetical protein
LAVGSSSTLSSGGSAALAAASCSTALRTATALGAVTALRGRNCRDERRNEYADEHDLATASLHTVLRRV